MSITTPGGLFELPEVGLDDNVWGGILNQNWLDNENELLARLRLNGADTMTGNLQIFKAGSVMIQLQNTDGAFTPVFIRVDQTVGSFSVTHPVDDLIALTADPRGTAMVTDQSAVTREKGDLRYYLASGETRQLITTGALVRVDRETLSGAGYFDLRVDAGFEAAYRFYDNTAGQYRKAVQVNDIDQFVVGNELWGKTQILDGNWETDGTFIAKTNVLRLDARGLGTQASLDIATDVGNVGTLRFTDATDTFRNVIQRTAADIIQFGNSAHAGFRLSGQAFTTQFKLVSEDVTTGATEAGGYMTRAMADARYAAI